MFIIYPVSNLIVRNPFCQIRAIGDLHVISVNGVSALRAKSGDLGGIFRYPSAFITADSSYILSACLTIHAVYRLAIHIILYVAHRLAIHVVLHAVYRLTIYIILHAVYWLTIHIILYPIHWLTIHIVWYSVHRLALHTALHTVCRLAVHIVLHTIYRLAVHIVLHTIQRLPIHVILHPICRLAIGRTGEHCHDLISQILHICDLHAVMLFYRKAVQPEIHIIKPGGIDPQFYGIIIRIFISGRIIVLQISIFISVLFLSAVLFDI